MSQGPPDPRESLLRMLVRARRQWREPGLREVGGVGRWVAGLSEELGEGDIDQREKGEDLFRVFWEWDDPGPEGEQEGTVRLVARNVSARVWVVEQWGYPVGRSGRRVKWPNPEKIEVTAGDSCVVDVWPLRRARRPQVIEGCVNAFEAEGAGDRRKVSLWTALWVPRKGVDKTCVSITQYM